jgi:serine/threonine protein kinase/Flp pilus assembly protein TadD
MSVPQETNSDRLAQLVEEWQQRLRNGEKPDVDEYARKYPDLADEIHQLLPGLAALEDLKGEALDRTIAPTGGILTNDAGPNVEQFGDYRILREVGRGGMGVVYEAEQISLGRHVALKVLPQKVILDARQKRRFEREAKAAAKLHHTNIVPVFGVGEHDGMPYYVMQFIQGLGLDAVMDEVKRMQGIPKSANGSPAFAPTVTRGDASAADVARSLMSGNFKSGESSDQESDPDSEPAATGPVKSPSGSSVVSGSTSSIQIPGVGQGRNKQKKQTYWQSVAAIGAQVADALDYAHTQGILHRDIKPSNLLLDTRGTVWVTDFGLAKATDHQDDLTHTGDVLGTLRYMPSEAFEGRSDARGDIYSLGLTLYEMLALGPAFSEKDRNKLVKQVTTGEPVHLNRINRSIPRDLVTVIHKAIDREPGRRYQSAREFADDLERYIANEPIQARRSGAFERTLRWVRRRPAAAALVGVSAVAAMAVAATVIVLLYSHKLERAKSDADQARAEAERARDAEAGQRMATEAALLDAENQRVLAETARRDAEAQREQAILSRGLLAVHTEQWAQAVSDLDGYTRAHPEDLKAWLGLAKAQGRTGQAQKSVDSYTRAISLAAANDTDSRVEAHLGRAEQETGRGKLSAAIADYGQAFELKPDQPEQAAAFARTLYEHWAGWRVLTPESVTATGGVALKAQPDGSIVPEGNLVGAEVFQVVSRTDLAGIRAIRLEILPEQSAREIGPVQRVPTYQSGNFILSEFVVEQSDGRNPGRKIALNRAWSDYHYPYYFGGYQTRQRQDWDIGAAIDGDSGTGWSVVGQYGRSHVGVFLTTEPASGLGETSLTVRLQFSGNAQVVRQNAIGRFRLSVSKREPVPAWECLMDTSTAGGWSKLAAARFLRGDEAPALDALGRAERSSSDQLTRAFLRAMILDQTQKAEAKAAYERAIQQAKSNTYGYANYGDLTYQWLAVEASSRMIEREPAAEIYRRNRAESFATLENWAEAIADYDRLIEKEPGDYRLLLERGYCESRRGRADKAGADFASAGRLNAEDSLAWHRLKLQTLEYMDRALSLPHLEACVSLEKGKPGEGEFLIKRGRLYAQLGRKNDAAADFARALELNPNSADALLERGAARAETGDLAAARADFAAARKLGTPNAMLWHNQQASKYEYGTNRNMDLALLQLNELVELESTPLARAQYLQRRIYALRLAKRWDEAIADFDRMLTIVPRQTSYLIDRADCFANVGKTDKATADLAEALKIDRNMASQQIRLRAASAEQAKDWFVALVLLDAGLKVKQPEKDESDLLLRRARAHAGLRNYAEAIADCDRVLARDPNNVEAGHAKASAYVTYAHELRLRDKLDEAKKVAEQARTFLKARFKAHANDERFQVEWINFLLGEAAAWQSFEITDMKSAAGAKLTKLPDASILVSGVNSAQDSYSLSGTGPGGLTAVRLDVLPDPSLPSRGPGRSEVGNFTLSEIALSVNPAKSGDLKPVHWSSAFATYVRPTDSDTTRRDGPRGAIDGIVSTRWDIHPQYGRANVAMFATDRPVGDNRPVPLSIQLMFSDPRWSHYNLGRFRLGISKSPYALHAEQIIAYPSGNWAQLAVAHALLGERAEAEAALRKSESISANNDFGILLLNAWTADLLGLAHQSKHARDKVIAFLRLKSSDFAVPIPAVAVEVLTKAAEEPDGVVARRWLARALDVCGDYDRALAAYTRALDDKVDERELCLERGDLYLHRQNWKQAAASFRMAVELKPDDHYRWLTTVPAIVLAGDESGYRQFREAMLARFANPTEAYVAERIAKAASFRPGTAEEAKQAVELARRAVSSGTYPQYQHWFRLAYSLASYRAKDYVTAIEAARLALESDLAAREPYVRVAARLVEALAQQALGKHDEARKLLDQAESISFRDLRDLRMANPDDNFHDLVLCNVLLDEARRAITPNDPWRERGPVAREVGPDTK